MSLDVIFKGDISDLKSKASQINGVIGAIGAGVSVAGMVAFTKNVINMADAIDDGSKRMSVSTEEFQRLKQMAELSGATIEDVEMAFKKIAGALDDAATSDEALQKFTKIGVVLSELKGKSPEEQFKIVATAIGKIQDPAMRAAAAVEFFGKSGTRLVEMGQNFNSLRAEVEATMSIIEDGAISSAARFNDELGKMSTNIQNMVTNSGLVDWLSGVAEGLNAVATLADMKGKNGLVTGSASYGGQGKGMSLFSNMKDAFFGESGGDKYYMGLTEAEQKALDERKQKRKETGLTLPEQKKLDEANKQKELDAQKAAAADKKKAEETAKKEERQTQQIDELKNAVAMQEMKNSGLEREAAIKQKIYELEKDGIKLTEEERKQVEELAGKQVDLERSKGLKDYQTSLADQLRKQKLMMEGKKKEVFIEEELEKARKAKGAELTDAEKNSVTAQAGELYDLQKKKDPQMAAEYSDSLRRIGGTIGNTANPSQKAIDNILLIMRQIPSLLNKDNANNSMGVLA